jgi:hypothetical protein
MYRRPILCTLYGAVDFLKVMKIAVVGGGGGGCYSMAGKKYWDVMYTLHPSTSSMIELHRPGIDFFDPSKCPLKWLIKLLSHKKKLCPAVS